MASNMDISNMKAVVGEFQRNYLYYLMIHHIPSGLSGKEWTDRRGVKFSAPKTKNTKFADYSSVADDLTEVDLYNKKAFFPKRKTADISQSWAGQTFHISGVDESEKTGTLEFNGDQQDKIYRFFLACQTLTGDEASHSAYDEVYQNFDMSIIRVDVSKTKQTQRRYLSRVKCLGVEETDPDKTSTDIGTVQVHLTWDLGEYIPIDSDLSVSLATASTLKGSSVSGEPYNNTSS